LVLFSSLPLSAFLTYGCIKPETPGGVVTPPAQEISLYPKRIALFALAVALASSAFIVPATADVAQSVHEDFVVEVFPHAESPVDFRDTWGARRSGGRSHKGTDILSPRGTSIVAVAPGTVRFMGKQRLSGYSIKIDHGHGWVTSYLHLNNDTPGTDDGDGGEEGAFAPGLEVGDRVEAGQLIGWVGDSGNAERTTTHTHFELKHGDTKVNPYPYLAAAWHMTARNGHPATQ
jgi:murein DD-endopeptidase MepM/ murein hydrolase activator NlpD